MINTFNDELIKNITEKIDYNLLSDEIGQYKFFEDLEKEFNKELNKQYGLSIEITDLNLNPCFLNFLSVDQVLDIIDRDKFYKFFMNTERSPELLKEIRDHSDYKDYGYTYKEFILEELDSIGDPYYRFRLNDIKQYLIELENEIISDYERIYSKLLNKFYDELE